jgi:hypothetical protein
MANLYLDFVTQQDAQNTVNMEENVAFVWIYRKNKIIQPKLIDWPSHGRLRQRTQ